MNGLAPLVAVTGVLIVGVVLFALGLTQVRERRPSLSRLAGPMYRGSGDVIAGVGMMAGALYLLNHLVSE